MSLFSEDLVYHEVPHEVKMDAWIEEMWKTLYPKMKDGDITTWWDANNVVKIVIKKIDE